MIALVSKKTGMRQGFEPNPGTQSWLLAACSQIATEFKVSVEASKWDFSGDTEDVAVADPEFSEEHDHIHYDVMRSHAIEVRFSTSGNGHPE